MEAITYITHDNVKSMIKERNKFASKHDFGHAILFAGSNNKIGASILATKACHRAGVGMMTTHIPSSLRNDIIAHSPETILSLDQNENIITSNPNLKYYNAVGCGPGIGTDTMTMRFMKNLLDSYGNPMVLDADALNILSINKIWQDRIPKNSIITPHHREFDRLVGDSLNNEERYEKQIEFARYYECIVVLKGANTSIVTPDGSRYINTTGNSGMATAGSGDVLTGLILGLMAQGYNPAESAIIGVYLHGKAGDIAVEDIGQHSLIASDLINYLPKAFLSLER